MPLLRSEWHYNRVIWDSNGEFLNPSRPRINVQRIVNPAQGGFGGGGLANMLGAAVALAERRGDPLLHREYLAQTRPGHGVPGELQFAPDRLHQLIGQHGDEQGLRNLMSGNFRHDLLIENALMVELKAGRVLDQAHKSPMPKPDEPEPRRV